MLETLAGTIIGGLITWAVTAYALKKQFEYERGIEEEKNKETKRKILLSLREELLLNKALASKILDDCKKHGNENCITIPYSPFEGHIWKSFKPDIVTYADEILIDKISFIYYKVTALNSLREASESEASEMIEVIEEYHENVEVLIGTVNQLY